jgi:2-hydroxychromene-2-carboxylate isomerase
MHLVEGQRYDAWIASADTGRPSTPHALEVYFDFSSPYAYLGVSQAEALAARTGAALTWRPMLLGGLFRAIGQADAPVLTFSEAKRAHTLRDLARWAEFYGLPYRFPSRFPVSSLKAMRCYLALPEHRRGAFRDAVLRAVWGEDRDLGDDGVLRALLGEGADATLEAASSPAVKEALKRATEDAVAAGVFGRGEYLKLKIASYCTWSSRASVSSIS